MFLWCSKERQVKKASFKKGRAFPDLPRKARSHFFGLAKKRKKTSGFDFSTLSIFASLSPIPYSLYNILIDLVYMDRLPDEIILRIVSFIATTEWQLLELEKVSRKLRW